MGSRNDIALNGEPLPGKGSKATSIGKKLQIRTGGLSPVVGLGEKDCEGDWRLEIFGRKKRGERRSDKPLEKEKRKRHAKGISTRTEFLTRWRKEKGGL